MNVNVALEEDVRQGARTIASEAGPAPKRIVVGYGFWIFLLSDIVMFAALFAAYAVLAHATAGGPSGAQLFNPVSVAIETACLLASSYTCGLMSLAIGSQRRLRTYVAAVFTFVLGAAFLTLELREFAGMIAAGAPPQRSAFLSAFFTLVGCHGLHVTAGLIWLAVMMLQIAVKGFRATVSDAALFFPVLARTRYHLGVAVHRGLSDGSPLMTDTRYDRAPGDGSAPANVEEGPGSGLLIYTIGFLLAVILTAMSFWVANTSLLWTPGVSLRLCRLRRHRADKNPLPVFFPQLAGRGQHQQRDGAGIRRAGL